MRSLRRFRDGTATAALTAAPDPRNTDGMEDQVNPHSQRGIRWPATPLAWPALGLLIPFAAVGGFLCSILAPLIWIALWLAPI